MRPSRITFLLACSFALSANAEPVFEERFSLTGIEHRHVEGTGDLNGIDDSLGAGVCAADFNNDGWQDLVFVGGSGTSRRYGRAAWWTASTSHRLYLNEGGHFTDRSDAFFGNDMQRARGMGCATVDWNADGYVDLLVTSQGVDRMFLNDRGRAFQQSVELAGSQGWSTTATVADLQQDGVLDLVIGQFVHYERDQKTLELTQGFQPSIAPAFDATLYDPASTLTYRFGEPAPAPSRALAVNGLNGRTLSVRAGANRLYLLNQSGEPSEAVALAETTTADSLGVANDAVELLIGTQRHLLLARGGGRGFQLRNLGADGDFDQAWELGLNNNRVLPRQLWALLAADFDRDGDQDVFAAAGAMGLSIDTKHTTLPQPNVLFEQHAGAFVERAPRTVPRSSRGAISVDLDNDGFLDVVVVNNNDVPTIMANRSAGDNAFVGFDAGAALVAWLGAEVCITGNTACQRLTLPTTFLSQSDARLLFPIPAGTSTPLELSLTSEHRSLRFSVPALNRYYQLASDERLVPVAPSGSTSYGHLPANRLIELLYARDPLMLARPAGVQLVLADTETRRTFAGAFEAAPDRAALGLAHRLLANDPAAAFAPGLVRGIGKLEDDQSTAVLLDILPHASNQTICAISELFVEWYDEEEAAILTKAMALPHLLHAAEQSKDPQATICLLNAIGASESVRTRHTLAGLLATADHEGVQVAVVRAMGNARHRGVIAQLNGTLQTTASPALAAEVLITLKKLTPAEQLADLWAQRADELPAASAALHLLQNSGSIVYERSDVLAVAAAALEAGQDSWDAVELAFRTDAPVRKAALASTTTQQQALALALGWRLPDASTPVDVLQALAADAPDVVQRFGRKTLLAVADNPDRIAPLTSVLTGQQQQVLVDRWLADGKPGLCARLGVRGRLSLTDATAAVLPCVDPASTRPPALLGFINRNASTIAATDEDLHSALGLAYEVSQLAGRGAVVRLSRELDPTRVAQLAARLAASDPSFLSSSFDEHWPRLAEGAKLDALSGLTSDASLPRLEAIAADANETATVRLAALQQASRITNVRPVELMPGLFEP